MLTTRSLAAGESVPFVQHWKPASAGKYHAMADLSGSSPEMIPFAKIRSR